MRDTFHHETPKPNDNIDVYIRRMLTYQEGLVSTRQVFTMRI